MFSKLIIRINLFIKWFNAIMFYLLSVATAILYILGIFCVFAFMYSFYTGVSLSTQPTLMQLVSLLSLLLGIELVRRFRREELGKK